MRILQHAERVTVTITAPVRKLCPIKDEVDDGTVTLTFFETRETPELHDLAADLALFADRKLSHEQFTALVAGELQCQVSSTWTTAGLTVTVEAVR